MSINDYLRTVKERLCFQDWANLKDWPNLLAKFNRADAREEAGLRYRSPARKSGQRSWRWGTNPHHHPETAEVEAVVWNVAVAEGRACV